MSSFLLGLFVGLVGEFLAFAVLGLCTVAKRADDAAERFEATHPPAAIPVAPPEHKETARQVYIIPGDGSRN